MKKLESHTVPKLDKPVRISDYLPGIFKAVSSKKGIKKAIEKKRVRVNGTYARTSKYLNGGEMIELIESKADLRKPTISLDLNVLYEDDYIAIIDKPAGIVVSGNKKRTIENALPTLLQKSNEPDALIRPLPAHRLDFPTSGILIIGKTSQAVTALNLAFEHRTINKTYHAITIGTPPEPKAVIDDVISGKQAISLYEIIESIDSEKYECLNLVKLQPTTGRRHQLRIHMHGIGTPILGDPLYYKEGLVSRGKGLYLHASNVNFPHPITKVAVNVSSILPQKFRAIFPNQRESTEEE